MEKAVEQAAVRIDFAGLTCETFLGALEEPIDRIRRGRLTPQSINSACCCRTSISRSIRELGELGLVPKVEVETRLVAGLPMMFKLYALNDEEISRSR
ncbi:hypothetical protein [Kribbella sp. NPDC004875]|uniref:hypothetical protein n=1 Tax=Kribbella sp. NPDC004875 TaxID=3364107 RepID=UPI00367FDB2C